MYKQGSQCSRCNVMTCPNSIHTACNSMYFARVAAVHSKSQKEKVRELERCICLLWCIHCLHSVLHSFTYCDLTVLTSLFTLTAHLNVLHHPWHAYCSLLGNIMILIWHCLHFQIISNYSSKLTLPRRASYKISVQHIQVDHIRSVINVNSVSNLTEWHLCACTQPKIICEGGTSTL